MINLNQILKNRKKILGRNERGVEYIRPNNFRRAIEIADDKILTKKVLVKAEVPVPKKIAVARNSQELEALDFSTFPSSFVIKPVHGLMGSGIEIFYNRDKEGKFIRADGSRASVEDLQVYLQDILDGKFSLFNEPDQILIEERVKLHKAFKYYAYKGAPDVRILVYNNIPIMSYLRLPTKESEGKANLDKGAIGAGVDLAVGKTTHAIVGKSTSIEFVPGTTLPLSGLKIPYWDRILEYAIKSSKASGLGFAAVDFLLDRDLGPLVVELNARPGLSIQLANDDGLRRRLKKAGGITVKTVSQGIRLAKDMFGGEIEEDIENISGKNVIGIYENVTLKGINEKEYTCKAKIDTGADRTSIDINVAYDLGYNDLIEDFKKIEFPDDIDREKAIELARKHEQELLRKYSYLANLSIVKSSHGVSVRPAIRITLTLDEITFETTATIYNRSKLDFPAIIGRKSLLKFLVDPSKSKDYTPDK